MKKILSMTLLLASLLSVNAKKDVPAPKKDVYAMAFRCIEVQKIDKGTERLTVENCNGDQYAFFADANDYFIGDDITCIMNGRGTANVNDDAIIATFSDRYDLLP